jgi:hypothetical protein
MPAEQLALVGFSTGSLLIMPIISLPLTVTVLETASEPSGRTIRLKGFGPFYTVTPSLYVNAQELKCSNVANPHI